MTERNWELYRLKTVEQMPDGPYRSALIEAIKHRLTALDATESMTVKSGSHLPRRKGAFA